MYSSVEGSGKLDLSDYFENIVEYLKDYYDVDISKHTIKKDVWTKSKYINLEDFEFEFDLEECEEDILEWVENNIKYDELVTIITDNGYHKNENYNIKKNNKFK